MKLQDIFDQLTYGELSQVFVGGGETQGITADNHKQILSHINLGLTELHKRCFLREGRITVIPVDGKRTYALDSKYAVSNAASTAPLKYIEDSADDPFRDDILKIERIHDQDGKELVLNDLDNEDSIQTPTYRLINLPDGHKHTKLEIVYRADHPALGPDIYPLNETEVSLPMTHLEALLLFVASRVLNPVGMVSEFHEGNNYAAKFEAAVQRLQFGGYDVDRLSSNSRFERNGWV